MEYKPFSKKQLQSLFWWVEGSGLAHYDAVICDGAVRSGKTFSLSLSFVMWGMLSFHNASLGLCGKTIGALRRNVIVPLLPCLKELGFSVEDNLSRNRLIFFRERMRAARRWYRASPCRVCCLTRSR